MGKQVCQLYMTVWCCLANYSRNKGIRSHYMVQKPRRRPPFDQ